MIQFGELWIKSSLKEVCYSWIPRSNRNGIILDSERTVFACGDPRLHVIFSPEDDFVRRAVQIGDVAQDDVQIGRRRRLEDQRFFLWRQRQDFVGERRGVGHEDVLYDKSITIINHINSEWSPIW